MSTETESIPHPFYPPSLHLPSYIAPTTPTSVVFLQFSGIFFTPLIVVYFTLLRQRIPSISRRFSALWFLLCALLHAIYEPFWVVKSLNVWYQKGHGWGDAMAADNSLFGQLFKEYGKGDSRYFQDDIFVLGVEIYTILVLAPLAFFAFLAHLKPNSPSLPILRILTSFTHLTTTSLYFITEFLRHHADSRPEPEYAIGYMWGMNLPWIIVPIFMIKNSWKEIIIGMKVARAKTDMNSRRNGENGASSKKGKNGKAE
ncbi:hypothetical protein BDN72DRAFT_844306 [Pluteus cervinus]|uniref:Uncharacterized protein n=1 Tax=Pluteus cervinus TaxID=181527 RepID=A0ACD3AL97_9AGAR|nr:hypothetical protein BDN72DRAFT_844306 [Pluteus cervinus]